MICRALKAVGMHGKTLDYVASVLLNDQQYAY